MITKFQQGRSVRDVSDLPTYAHGQKNILWWGNLAFITIEGLAFAFAIATYFYLMNQNQNWPLAAPPDWHWGAWLTGLMVLSEIPNVWVKKAGRDHDLKKARVGLILMSVIGLIAIGIRYYEFSALKVRWNENAYGSIIWFILGYHTTHLITDVGETIVMAVLIHIGPVDKRRFPEIEDNQDYWHFVVGTWIIVFLVLYAVPRWFGVPA